MINFVVLTLFKEMFENFENSSIIKRAIENKKLSVDLLDIRDFADNDYRKIDDTPYGGGAGMVIEAEPVARAIEKAISMVTTSNYEIIYMSPRGEVLSQNMCYDYSKKADGCTYILICGHYEGIDERVLRLYNVKEISIGDYVLTGGELPAMVFIDCITRLVDGVITKESLDNESHTNGLLEYPQYTKPSTWRNLEVPEILLSGNHKKIDEYRNEESVRITMKNRPDLLKKSKKEGI